MGSLATIDIMKKILSVILLLLSTVVGTISLAASTSWGSQGSDPIDILKQVKQDSTVSDHDSLQKTALDDVEGD